VAAHSLKNHDLDAAILLLDRIIASAEVGAWYREALLSKGDFLWHRRSEPEAALACYDVLAELPPLYEDTRGGVVGYGLLARAELYDQEFGDTQHALELLEDLVSRANTIPNAQGMVFRKYAKMLYREDDFEHAVEICEQGLAAIPRTDEQNRAWLQAVRAASEYRVGTLPASELQALLDIQSRSGIRAFLESALKGKAGQ
jgi:tetratricopeptide (TPR) repeat protein